jgi:dienelactone hydrolase/phage FluMu protein Com
MPITVRCSSCDKKLRVQDSLLGKKVKCPGCNSIIRVEATGGSKENVQPVRRTDAGKSATVGRRLRDNQDDEAEYDQDESPRRRPTKKEKKPFFSAANLGVGAGALFMIVVAVRVIFMFIGGPANNKVAFNNAPKAEAPSTPAPNAAVPNAAVPNPSAPSAETVSFPDLSPAKNIQPGIRFQEATLQRGAMPMRVWYYQPEKAVGKLPLVVVPPAGSTLFVGMDLGDGDRAEHYPYARAGFAVMSFEIDGAVADIEKASDAVMLKGAREFRDAQAGLANAKVALDYILAKSTTIDADHIYVAGHSSAATLALLVAAFEPRIKACAAYAPVTDVETRLAKVAPALDRALPGFKTFLQFSSPKTHIDKLKCPVFLFFAKDDGNVPPQHSTDFAANLKKTNPNVTLVSVQKGGHYDSMIREGIPKGIAWLNAKKGASIGAEKPLDVAKAPKSEPFISNEKAPAYQPLALDNVATITTARGMFNNEQAQNERLTFPVWGPKTFEGIPFQFVDPKDGQTPNAILLYSQNGKVAAKMPKSVNLPCNSSASEIHLLSGVSGWGFPSRRDKEVTLIVRLHYQGGNSDDHELKNGEHFADYARRVDVPNSKFAFELEGGKQIRYLSIKPSRQDIIERIEFIKGPHTSAPLVLAVTLQTSG